MGKMKKQLFLHEEVMLLALRNREGTIPVQFGTNFQYAIGGAVLADLLLEGRVGVETKRKKKYLKLTDSTPFGNAVIDECLQKVSNAKRRAQLRAWVSRFAGVRRLKHKVAEQLCRQGILRSDEDKVLLIFSRKIYPEIDAEPERRVVDRLKEAIFTDTANVEPRTAILLSLAKSADVLKVTFDKKELRGRKDRIKRIANGEVTGKATKEAIDAMKTAAMVTVMMTTTY